MRSPSSILALDTLGAGDNGNGFAPATNSRWNNSASIRELISGGLISEEDQGSCADIWAGKLILRTCQLQKGVGQLRVITGTRLVFGVRPLGCTAREETSSVRDDRPTLCFSATTISELTVDTWRIQRRTLSINAQVAFIDRALYEKKWMSYGKDIFIDFNSLLYSVYNCYIFHLIVFRAYSCVSRSNN